MLWNPPRFDTDGRPRDAYPRVRRGRLIRERRERSERRKRIAFLALGIPISGAIGGGWVLFSHWLAGNL